MSVSIAVDNTDAINHNKAVIAELEKQAALGNPTPLHKAFSLINTDALDLKQRKALGELYGMNASELKSAFAKLAHNNELHEALGVVPENEYEFVNALLAKWETTMNFQRVFTINTPYKLDNNLFTETSMASEKFEESMKVYIRSADPKTFGYVEMFDKIVKASVELELGYNTEKCKYAFHDWIYNAQNNLIATAKMNVTHDVMAVIRAEPEWDKLVGAITDVNVDETKAVLKHFIWQIKRKMFGKPVQKHMMPVLCGLQEIGKSTIVHQLVEPIKEFTVVTNFKDMTDGRSHDMWKNYVLILDEMGNSTQANIEEVKQKITSESFSSRIMKTNNDAVIINYTTMIGTSNKDLSRLIFDDTGMRRFFQITCRNKFDWAVTGSIDYMLLWKSINENADTPLKDETIAARVKVLQNEKRFKTLIEQFFEDREYVSGVLGETLLAEDLFKEYQEYERKMTPRPEMTATKFFRDIIDMPSRIPQLQIEKLPRSNKGNRYRIAWVGEREATIESVQDSAAALRQFAKARK